MDRRDVGMIERREQAAFALETRARLSVCRELWFEEFERNRPTQPRVARAIHGAHPALADERVDAIRAERAARCQVRHGSPGL